jgi:hypothetical protein
VSTGRKTTDFERLTQPDGKALPDDDTIPVLTERLTLPSLELDISLPQAPAPAAAAPAASPSPRPAAVAPMPGPRPAPAAPPAPKPPPRPPAPASAAVPPPAPAVPAPRPAPAAPPASAFAVPAVAPPVAPAPVEPNWPEVEARVREILLREMQPRLVAELDRQLRERLQPAMVRTLLATISELRPSIESAVREVIEQTVANEITRQRSGK